MEIISMLSGLLFLASSISFLVGLILILSKNQHSKKDGIKILQYSVIGLIVGFGTCAAVSNGKIL